MATELIGVKEFRMNIAEYYKKAQKKGTKYIILNRNTPIFEVRPLRKGITQLESLISDIKTGRDDIKNNKTHSLTQARKKLGL